MAPVNATLRKERRKLKCYICGKAGEGGCLQCMYQGCYRAFHVLCANFSNTQNGGRCYLELEGSPRNPSVSGVRKAICFCGQHAAESGMAWDEKKMRWMPLETLLPPLSKWGHRLFHLRNELDALRVIADRVRRREKLKKAVTSISAQKFDLQVMQLEGLLEDGEMERLHREMEDQRLQQQEQAAKAAERARERAARAKERALESYTGKKKKSKGKEKTSHRKRKRNSSVTQKDEDGNRDVHGQRGDLSEQGGSGRKRSRSTKAERAQLAAARAAAQALKDRVEKAKSIRLPRWCTDSLVAVGNRYPFLGWQQVVTDGAEPQVDGISIDKGKTNTRDAVPTIGKDEIGHASTSIQSKQLRDTSQSPDTASLSSLAMLTERDVVVAEIDAENRAIQSAQSRRRKMETRLRAYENEGGSGKNKEEKGGGGRGRGRRRRERESGREGINYVLV